MKRLLPLVVLSLIPLAACSKSGTVPGIDSGGDFAITVTGGTTPTISWPGGNALGMSVLKMNGAQTEQVWMVNQSAQGGFASPVTYGTLPAGAQHLAPSVALQAGQTYRVNVARVDNKGAYRDFTP
jgi:hypothetical protein